jgi:mannose-6-phosphate isomerase-like protein (cupin superfamily)
MSFVVRPTGHGAAYDFDGARFVIKASGAETGGQLAVMEVLSPAGLEVPPHVHDGEDEMFYVLSGDLTGEQLSRPVDQDLLRRHVVEIAAGDGA